MTTTIIALTKSLIVVAIATCGVSGPAEDNPDEIEPPDQVEEDKHFCCTSVDQAKLTGEGCIGIPDDNAIINSCLYVLCCSGDWTKADGKVVCE